MSVTSITDQRAAQAAAERPAVAVYSRPDCVQCKATYRALDKHGITYTVIDTSQDADAAEYARSLGFMQAPVIVPSEGEPWAGFRPDRIAALAA